MTASGRALLGFRHCTVRYTDQHHTHLCCSCCKQAFTRLRRLTIQQPDRLLVLHAVQPEFLCAPCLYWQDQSFVTLQHAAYKHMLQHVYV